MLIPDPGEWGSRSLCWALHAPRTTTIKETIPDSWFWVSSLQRKEWALSMSLIREQDFQVDVHQAE